ncbi:serine/threonine-protein kinase [Streptomyces sp. AM 2-1-1]|uniref:serine/threonine-protein kinase n=1 Tax=Streptomyces sp. AM 2-1-1 TaxID=3028709 RepID=UPI0023B9B645|nr:serine/threonine-protein kinase [Streptomyces sp. AM 2-1-1]WEH43374.1 tetratricopeptide repeat-containing serine/threonine protein kinase [Streptomyces sp. AM 2-1-1]
MAETRLIQDRYQLLDLIGRGGMGEVWRARDESLGRHVAVKCLKPSGPPHDRSFTRVLRERFRREARVAAALQHRGVTVVHDFGEHDGVLYLVMELLEGRNLSQLLEDNGRRALPVDDVIDIAEQVADALGYTHRQGIVHRDLKPANIMRLTDGTVKICDFGIARLAQDIGFTSKLTGTGISMGTPHYMSPEQIGGVGVDHRSDLYSLGCVLYEIATGAPPFDLDDAWGILVAHRDTPPVPPRTHRAELPGYFERIVLDLLAKSPGQRPEDAVSLRRRILLARTGGERETGPAGHPHLSRAAVPALPPALAGAPAPLAAPAGPPALPPAIAGPPALPDWTRSMTTGRRVAGTRSGAAAPPDHVAALTGAWTTGIRPAPPSPALPGAPAADVLRSLAGRHEAGLALSRLGRWAEAGEIHRAVAAERARLLGAAHPEALASRYERGFALSRTGHDTAALEEFGQVAEGRSRAFGPDHPETLAARQETAYVLGRLGRYAEAHRVYAAVLAARERTAGPDHPDTLRCRHNLAYNLGRLGRAEESYRMFRGVAEARARVLGADHPDTLVSLFEVGYALGRSGRWQEALDTYARVARDRTHALGAGHPDTLSTRYEIGICLGRLGRIAEATELYRALVHDRTAAGGPDDPETLRARHGLGVNLGRLGRWEEALAEASAVFAARERTLGPDHPDTLVSCRERAVSLGWLGRWAEALVLYRRVAEARTRLFGAGHPDAVASRDDEAHCLEQLRSGAPPAGPDRPAAPPRPGAPSSR